MKNDVLCDYTSIMNYDVLFLLKYQFAGSRSRESQTSRLEQEIVGRH